MILTYNYWIINELYNILLEKVIVQKIVWIGMHMLGEQHNKNGEKSINRRW